MLVIALPEKIGSTLATGAPGRSVARTVTLTSALSIRGGVAGIAHGQSEEQFCGHRRGKGGSGGGGIAQRDPWATHAAEHNTAAIQLSPQIANRTFTVSAGAAQRHDLACLHCQSSTVQRDGRRPVGGRLHIDDAAGASDIAGGVGYLKGDLVFVRLHWCPLGRHQS